MTVSVIDIFTVIAAFVICFIIAECAKNYVRNNCMNNPEIIWIWLDDDDNQNGGIRVKEKAGSFFAGPRSVAVSMTAALYE